MYCTVVNNRFIIYYNTLIEYFTCLQFILVSLLERLLKCGLCFYIRLHTRILLLLIVNNNQGIKMFAKLKKKICKPFLFQPLFCPSHCLRILYKKNVRSTLYRIFDKSYSYTRPAIIAAWARVNVSVSPRHLSVSPRHLSVSPRHLSVSPHHLSVSPRHLFVSPRHLSISSRHFGFLALRTPVGRLWTSARHFSRRPMAT